MKTKIEETNGVIKYWVNNVPYDRLEDMPAEFREYFADKNNNGIPDQFDNLMDSVNKKGEAGLFYGIFGASESEKPSILPTLIKIAVGIFIVLFAVWLYLMFV